MTKEEIKERRKQYNQKYHGTEKGKETRRRSRRKWQKSNPDKHTSSVLKSVYGITLDDYNKMYAAQEGLCAICGSDRSNSDRSKRFYIDHCHKTGKVRGLLCVHCNWLLGNAKDSVDILGNAANYLLSYKNVERP